MDGQVSGSDECSHSPHSVTNFSEKSEIAFCCASPSQLFNGCVIQRTNTDLETRSESGPAPIARDSGRAVPDSQGSLSSIEIAMVRRFFELLAKWEGENNREN